MILLILVLSIKNFLSIFIPSWPDFITCKEWWSQIFQVGVDLEITQIYTV